jgi:hypothetical protein
VVGLVGLALATIASGATPPASSRFSGTGGNYRNQSSSWVRHGTASFSFRISSRNYSPGRRYVDDFRGTYSTACSSHTLRLSATGIPVHKNGTFVLRFHDSGAWVKIWGAFRGQGGRRANVNYLANFSRSQSDNQRSPGSLGCAAWVRGTAHAR